MLAKDLEHISNKEAHRYFQNRQVKRLSSKKELNKMANTISIAFEDRKMNMYAIEVNGFRVLVARAIRGYNKRGAAMYEYVTGTYIAPDYNMSNRQTFKARTMSQLVKKLQKLDYCIVKAC